MVGPIHSWLIGEQPDQEQVSNNLSDTVNKLFESQQLVSELSSVDRYLFLGRIKQSWHPDEGDQLIRLLHGEQFGEETNKVERICGRLGENLDSKQAFLELGHFLNLAAEKVEEVYDQYGEEGSSRALAALYPVAVDTQNAKAIRWLLYHLKEELIEQLCSSNPPRLKSQHKRVRLAPEVESDPLQIESLSNDCFDALTYPDDEGNTLLHYAVTKGNDPLIRAIIKRCGPEQVQLKRLLYPNKKSMSPIHFSILTNNKRCVETLFECLPAQIWAYSVNPQWCTPILFAIELGNREIAEFLLTNFHPDFSLAGLDTEKLLAFIAAYGQADLVNLAVEKMRERGVTDNLLSTLMSSSLYNATEYGQAGVIEKLLDLISEDDVINYMQLNFLVLTPLQTALMQQHRWAAATLIQKCPVNLLLQTNPLHHIATYGDTDLLNQLFSRLSQETKDKLLMEEVDGCLPIDFTSMFGKGDMALAMFKGLSFSQKKITLFRPFRGCSLLFLATQTGFTLLVAELLKFQRGLTSEEKEKFWEKDVIGNSPLFYIFNSGSIEMVEQTVRKFKENELLELAAPNIEGSTPLLYCLNKYQVEDLDKLFKLLRQQGYTRFEKHLIRQNKRGRTLLHEAAQQSRPDLVEYLLKSRWKKQLLQPDFQQISALFVATEASQNQKELIDALRNNTSALEWKRQMDQAAIGINSLQRSFVLGNTPFASHLWAILNDSERVSGLQAGGLEQIAFQYACRHLMLDLAEDICRVAAKEPSLILNCYNQTGNDALSLATSNNNLKPILEKGSDRLITLFFGLEKKKNLAYKELLLKFPQFLDNLKVVSALLAVPTHRHQELLNKIDDRNTIEEYLLCNKVIATALIPEGTEFDVNPLTYILNLFEQGESSERLQLIGYWDELMDKASHSRFLMEPLNTLLGQVSHAFNDSEAEIVHFKRHLISTALGHIGLLNSPYNVHRALIEMREKEISHSLPIKGAEIVTNNLIPYSDIDRSALPQHIDYDTLMEMVENFEERYRSMDEEEKVAISTYIETHIVGKTEPPQEPIDIDSYELFHQVTNDLWFSDLLEPQQLEEETLNPSAVQLRLAIDYISKEEQTTSEGPLLSPQEEALLGFLQQVTLCEGGKTEGLSIYSSMIPSRYKRPNLNPQMPTKALLKEYLSSEVLSTLRSREFILAASDNELVENDTIHAFLYLKQLLFLTERVEFDIYSSNISFKLINKSLDEIQTLFKERFNFNTAKKRIIGKLNDRDWNSKENLSLFNEINTQVGTLSQELWDLNEEDSSIKGLKEEAVVPLLEKFQLIKL